MSAKPVFDNTIAGIVFSVLVMNAPGAAALAGSPSSVSTVVPLTPAGLAPLLGAAAASAPAGTLSVPAPAAMPMALVPSAPNASAGKRSDESGSTPPGRPDFADPAYDEVRGFPEFQELPEDIRRAFAEQRRLLAIGQVEASAEDVEGFFRLPAGDPMKRYEDYSFFEAARRHWRRIPKRIAPADTMTAVLARGSLPPKPSLAIADFGHGHSVAMAVMLAEAGWKPVVKMTVYPLPLQQIQAAGAMKFYAAKMGAARALLRHDSPPAIILEQHTRDDSPRNFPPPEDIRRLWGNRVAWFVEAPVNEVREIESASAYEKDVIRKLPEGQYTTLPALPGFLKAYLDAGVRVEAHFVMPYTGGLRRGSHGHIVFQD